VHAVILVAGRHAHHSNKHGCRRVKQPYEGLKYLIKNGKRVGKPKRNRNIFPDSERLRGKLSDGNGKISYNQQPQYNRKRFAGRAIYTQRDENRVQHLDENIFTNPAKQKVNKSNTKLCGGNVSIQMVKNFLRPFSAEVPFSDKGINFGRTHPYNGVLRNHKNSVNEDKDKYEDQL